ncbi:MAG: protein kinase [Anaerolineae bacterium]|nr:protein kinase [Anaerolineae bacterium]
MAAQEQLLNGRYRLISQQGSGGMAVVYKAQDLALGRTVAIKILRPSLTSEPSFLNRFRQEARNVANLTHPNIVTLYDVGQDGNTYYMVMEFVESQDLKKLIRASAPFSVERGLKIGIQICAGLGYAHRAGLVHADVKPQNILVDANDNVKITDFGIAQALSHTQPQSRQSVVWGSPHYFSPEQAMGEPPTPAADVYAIGIVLFEMLTGRLPYNGNDQQELAMAHIKEQVPHVRDLNPNVPANVDWVINKVMSKEPANRYRTADQLGRILESYQKQLGLPPQPSAPVGAPAGATQTQVNLNPQSASSSAAATYPSGIPVTPPYPASSSAPGAAPATGRGPMQPAIQPRSGSLSRSLTGHTPSEGVRPVTGPFRPPAAPPSPLTGGAAGPYPGAYSPDIAGGARSGNTPSVPHTSTSSRASLVTIALGLVAFLMVMGLIVLALALLTAFR